MTDLRETCADRGAAPVRGVPEEIALIGPSKARDLLASIGWLSEQPDEFQDQVFRRAVSVKYRAGEVIYRLGDPGGRHLRFRQRGSHRERRAARCDAATDARADAGQLDRRGVVPEPPAAPHRVAGRDRHRRRLPAARADGPDGRTRPDGDAPVHADPDDESRPGAEAPSTTCQDPDEHRRIARALRRVAALEQVPIPLAQAALGMLSNTSRKTVNAALKRFAEEGLGASRLTARSSSPTSRGSPGSRKAVATSRAGPSRRRRTGRRASSRRIRTTTGRSCWSWPSAAQARRAIRARIGLRPLP